MFRLRSQLPPRPARNNLVMAVTALSLVIGAASPSYTDYVKRIHRTHARAALLTTAQWMERTATAQGQYPTAANIPRELLLVEGGRYTILALSRDSMSYTLTATPNAAQSSDKCGAYQINHAGVRVQVATFVVANTQTRYQVVATALASELAKAMRGNHRIALGTDAANNPYLIDHVSGVLADAWCSPHSSLSAAHAVTEAVDPSKSMYSRVAALPGIPQSACSVDRCC